MRCGTLARGAVRCSAAEVERNWWVNLGLNLEAKAYIGDLLQDLEGQVSPLFIKPNYHPFLYSFDDALLD